MQSVLRRMGLCDDPIDGRIGGRSREAVKAFQSARGLPAHGIITRATLVALGLPTAVEGEAPRPAISSTHASAQWALALEQLGEDPRMVKAVKQYPGGRQVTQPRAARHSISMMWPAP